MRISLLAALMLLPSAGATDQVLVIGDSLSKEYELEFKGIFPDNPDAWDARNWCELLDRHRNTWFDLGSFETYVDIRGAGHEYNWAKPGGTAREIRNFLRYERPEAEAEIRSSSSGDLLWPFIPLSRDRFDADLAAGKAERVVIMLGGNDLALGNSDPLANPTVNGQPRQIDYHSIYRNDGTALANPDPLRDSIRKNIRSVVQYIRETRGWDGPAVLCAVPHVGCTPHVQDESPTHPVKTARITAMLETLTVELQALADEFDMGFADIHAMTRDIIDKPFYIGGVEFRRESDADCRPRYLFSGDGFHPNTPAQARMGQIVLDAFRAKYPSTSGSIPRLTDRQILDILDIHPDTGLREWAAAAGLPGSQQDPGDDSDGDGLENFVEFSFNETDPTRPDPSPVPPPVLTGGPAPCLSLTWHPRPQAVSYAEIIPQKSSNLIQWTDLPASHITANADGSSTACVAIGSTPVFLRLKVVRRTL